MNQLHNLTMPIRWANFQIESHLFGRLSRRPDSAYLACPTYHLHPYRFLSITPNPTRTPCAACLGSPKGRRWKRTSATPS